MREPCEREQIGGCDTEEREIAVNAVAAVAAVFAASFAAAAVAVALVVVFGAEPRS